MWMKLVFPCWPKLSRQTEFHLPPHGATVFAATVPEDVRVTFVDENREELDASDHPDVVALSVLLTCQVPRAKAIAAAYGARGVPVIAGGIGVMLHAEEMASACDAVLLGEAEGRTAGLLDDLRRGELRKVYDFMRAPAPIESVGTARRDLLDRERYTYRGVRMVDLVHASRGCRFRCKPCPTGFLGGRVFRPRPIERVVEEIESIDNPRLFLVDNSLAQDRAWELRLFEALEPLGRSFVSHPIEADDEVLEAARRAGSWYVYQAITEPSRGIRDRVRRYHDHGIGVEGTVVLGTDDQDEDGLRRLVDFTLEIELDMAEFNVLTPYPHTAYRAELEAEGRIRSHDWAEYGGDRVLFEPKRMSAGRLQDLYHWAWDRFYGEAGQQVRMARLLRRVLAGERDRTGRSPAAGRGGWRGPGDEGTRGGRGVDDAAES